MPPIYKKIMNSIQLKITNNTYSAHDKLPSESELMKEFNTSRITVIRALNDLEAQSIIYRQKGKGSFVSPKMSYKNNGTDIIALVLPHQINLFSGGQQYAYSIAKYCEQNNYLCSINYSNQLISNEKNLLENLINYNVSGAIIYPIGNENITALSNLYIKNFPMVLLDKQLEELGLSSVGSDNYNGAYNAVEYLIKNNHKAIGFIGSKDSDVVQARYKGYCRALIDNSIVIRPELIVSGYNNTKGDEQTILSIEDAKEILTRMKKNGVSAIFCVNDLTANIIMQAANILNISIPNDISLMGFDHIQFGDIQHPNLSSVAQNFDTIAKEAVQLLIKKINSPNEKITDNIIVPTHIYKGDTVRCL